MRIAASQQTQARVKVHLGKSVDGQTCKPTFACQSGLECVADLLSIDLVKIVFQNAVRDIGPRRPTEARCFLMVPDTLWVEDCLQVAQIANKTPSKPDQAA